ncbi:MAG TPA: response regulator [Rubrivivax sp.]|nr:response regulator [Rubrivivax sp.]
MDRIWLAAPAPALRLDAARVATPNPAARALARAQGWSDDVWQRLAAQAAARLADASAPRDIVLRVHGRELGGRLVPLDEGALLWLLAPAPAMTDAQTAVDECTAAAAPPAAAAARAPVLADGLHVEPPLHTWAPRRELDRALLAIDAAGIGVWERDANGRMVYWNDAMYRMRGLDPRDPRPLEELAAQCMPEEDRERVGRLIASNLARGEAYSTELRVRCADGRWRWLAAHGRAVRDREGRSRGIVGVHLDITERKESELLQREKERVEQASRDKSAFMARISHELRTPLNAVLGFARLLDDDRDEPPSARQRERLHRIADAGHRLLALVDDMLELARVEAGAVAAPAPVPMPVVLAALLDDARGAVKALAREQGVALVVSDIDTRAVAAADPARLLRALTLVLQHALGRSAPGSQVRLRAGCAPEARTVFVQVADDGPQLSAEQHLWLFESFAPLDRSADADDEGSLRLSLARGLVQSQDGRLQASARSDGGLDYRLELPRAVATRLDHAGFDGAGVDGAGGDGAGFDGAGVDGAGVDGAGVDGAGGDGAGGDGSDAAAARAAVVTAPAAPAAAARPLRVLCVEDNPVNLLLVRELLALRPGVQLASAEDGASALALASEHAPELLLLDMQLPDMHGIELMGALRALPQCAASTFVALSADAVSEHVERALAAGFDAYWTKPIDFDHFLAEFDRLAAARAG